MALEPKRMVLGLVTVQLADAIFNAIPTRWLKEDLDRLGFPEELRLVLPVVKGGSALGLLAGFRWPSLGRRTAAALVAYFVAAMGFHARAKDAPLRYVPAAAMLTWSLLVLRNYRAESI
ncbi:MAG: DoxX family protein [Acidimicrobiales bacterium]